MLKITNRSDGPVTIFDLEGKLAGPWVDELEQCWQGALRDGGQIRVVLKTVTFIDAAGRRLLTDMHRQGTKLIADGCMTKAIVEEIKGANG